MGVSQAFLIKSSSGAAELRLDAIDRYNYVVTLRDTGMEAAAKVYQHGAGDGLAEFFAGIAADWRGWKGSRTWESLEGTFALDAGVDRTGHVALTARLNDDTPWHWRVQSVLIADAGQLERLARDAAAFCGLLEAAT
jgi:hypothetical protein